MLATVRDITWTVLNVQYLTPQSESCGYSDITGGSTENY